FRWFRVIFYFPTLVNFLRGQHVTGHMWSEVVINIYGFYELSQGLAVIIESIFHMVFMFQYSIQPFGYGIIVRASRSSHTDGYVMRLEGVYIGYTTILNPSIRMMHELHFRI